MKRQEEIVNKAKEEAWYIADTSQTKEEAAIGGYCLGAAYADLTACGMNWLPIDRDENGFATEECTKEALKQIPIIIRGYDELGEYHHLLTEDSLECDKMAIFKFKTYTHYLPIPKLEV